MSPKLKLNIHLTKSPKRDHIYKSCLKILSVTILKHFVKRWQMNITAQF